MTIGPAPETPSSVISSEAPTTSTRAWPVAGSTAVASRSMKPLKPTASSGPNTVTERRKLEDGSIEKRRRPSGPVGSGGPGGEKKAIGRLTSATNVHASAGHGERSQVPAERQCSITSVAAEPLSAQ